MRSSLSAALLFLGAMVASSLALAGCSAASGEAQADGEAATGDDELNAVNNKMGLRLVYDASSNHVRATVKSKLQPGEKLMLRVRRGRIAVSAMNDLDCSQLTVATPLVASTYVTRNTVYVGPEMDPTLLVNVYKQEWIDQNINATALDRLSRDGADAIVDACIVADRGVRARLQTSLAYAWDAADPNASAQIVNLR
jgi:outer membrane murein-binding lipoprotein Lpp